MIKPSVGRVVWFYPRGDDSLAGSSDQPLAALVAYVWTDTLVTLMVIDKDGQPQPRLHIPLGAENHAPEESYCDWMPYQKAVAKGEIAPNLHATTSNPLVIGDDLNIPHAT